MILPDHGTTARSADCSCVPCVFSRRHGPTQPFSGPLRHAWSLRRLLNVCGAGTGATLKRRFGNDKYAEWEANGMPDFEADAACIFLDRYPHTVFDGWYEAAADWYTEEYA